MNKIIKLLLIFIISIPLLSCGGFKKVDQRSRPTDPEERRRQFKKEEALALMICLKEEVVQILNSVPPIQCGEYL